ncbi:hypothetical protein GCM10023311_28580 [Flaviramulus aquimarinus]|uniref:DUF8201 domain-containing protein n=2 Tax=Flaviramulus aquimarinus TaxID=1170456 RepID=A0ABP9FG47_9FLAO
MAILIVLSIILFVQNFKTLKGSLASYIAISSTMLILFLCKNAIISGYLFYPIELFDFLNFEWKQPKALLNFYKRGTYLDGMNNVDTSHLNFFETFKYWLTIPKLDGLFNSFYILLLILFPWFLLKKNKASGLFIIYTLSILQLILLWNNSPQYRFFFAFIMFLSVQIFISVFKNKMIGFYLVCIAIVASAFSVFFNINLKHFTDNALAMDSNSFSIKHIIVPAGISKTTTKFTKETINGFEFYSPNSDMFIWGTGNGNLPCVNKKQVNYIKTYYHYTPVLRTKNQKDGFLSVPTENEIIKTNF